jgi:DNA-binding transcriptional ArsR family regulator
MVEYKPPSKSARVSAGLDATFSAMADPTRRAILARLALADARVTEIAGDFPVSLNAISKHIKMLERAELVRRTVRGRDHILSLNAEAMADAAEWIEYYRQFWGGRLASLETFVINRRKIARKGART